MRMLTNSKTVAWIGTSLHHEKVMTIQKKVSEKLKGFNTLQSGHWLSMYSCSVKWYLTVLPQTVNTSLWVTLTFGSTGVLQRLTQYVSSHRSPSKPLDRKLMGVTDWEAVSRNSLSEERLETRSLPTRSPPGTPDQWVPLRVSVTPIQWAKTF